MISAMADHKPRAAADDILGAMLRENQRIRDGARRGGLTPVSGSVPNDMDAFDAFANQPPGYRRGKIAPHLNISSTGPAPSL